MAKSTRYANTIHQAREAARLAEVAANRLEIRDAWHIEHAAHALKLAQTAIERARRQIERAAEAKGLCAQGQFDCIDDALAAIVARDRDL